MKEIPLMQFANGERGRPFIWGDTDCVALAVRAAAVWRGTEPPECTWTDEASARERAGIEPFSVWLARSGWQQGPAGLYAVGDIFIVSHEKWGECAHVCLGLQSLSADLDHGVTLVNTAALVRLGATAWRAG